MLALLCFQRSAQRKALHGQDSQETSDDTPMMHAYTDTGDRVARSFPGLFSYMQR